MPVDTLVTYGVSKYSMEPTQRLKAEGTPSSSMNDYCASMYIRLSEISFIVN